MGIDPHNDLSDPSPTDRETGLDATQRSPSDNQDASDSMSWEAPYHAAIEMLNTGDAAQAVVLAREAVRAAADSEDDNALPFSLDLLASACMAAKDWSEANVTLQKLAVKGSEVFGSRQPVAGAWLAMLGDVCVRQGYGAAAEPLLRNALQILALSLTHDPIVFDSLGSHESRIFALSAAPLAEEFAASAPPGQLPEWPTHPAAMRPLVLLGIALCQQGKCQESIRYCAAAIRDIDLLRTLGWGDDDGAAYWRGQAQSTKQHAEKQSSDNADK